MNVNNHFTAQIDTQQAFRPLPTDGFMEMADFNLDFNITMTCDVDNTRNYSNGVPETVFYYDWEKCLYEILLPFMFLFAGLSNILFLMVVARVHFMRTTTNFYLVNLAISDMFYILGTTSFFTIRYFSSPIRLDSSLFGWAGCYCTYLFGAVFFYTSMILISLVSLDRYLAICHPLNHMVIKTRSRTVKIVVGGWCFGVISSVITIFVYLDFHTLCIIWPDLQDFKDFPATIQICGFGDENIAPNLVVVIGTCIVWILTSLCNGFFYCKLLCSVRSVDRNLTMTKSARNKKQVTLILVINGTIFFICSSMYFISFIIVAIGTNGNEALSSSQEVAWFCMIYVVTFINSSVHSVVYNVASQQYRKAFILTLTCSASSSGPNAQSNRNTNIASRL